MTASIVSIKAMPKIIHKIDPAMVTASVAQRVADFGKGRAGLKSDATIAVSRYQAAIKANRKWDRRIPNGPEHMDTYVDGLIRREEEYYASVQIIERVGVNGDPEFCLTYNSTQSTNEMDCYTGPFATLEKATNWFVKGGR